MAKKLKKNVKIIIGLAVCCGIVATGLVLYIVNDKNKVGTETSTISYEITDTELKKNHSITYEYANDTLNTNEFIEMKDGTFKVDPTTINLSCTGNYNVTYTFSSEDNKKTEKLECTIKVEDTQGPIITVDSESVETNSLDEFDPMTNIISVEDVVDGALAKIDEEPKKLANSNNGKVYEVGWYTVTLDKENLVVYIKAVDNHGNISEKSYSVNVIESDKEDLSGLYYYPSLDLNDGSAWVKVTSDFSWYYDNCSYYSGQYSSMTDAYNDVINYESSQGVTVMDAYVRIFRQEDKDGNILYYQAGYEGY